MANLRAIRQRIRSVQSTQKITRAMQMVAGAKLRRAQEELVRFRPYENRLEGMTHRFLGGLSDLSHPFIEKSVGSASEVPGASEVKTPPAGLVLICSDTGLCGTYNERVSGIAEKFLSEHPSAVVVTIGKKAQRRMVRRNIPVRRPVLDWGGRFDPSQVEGMAQWLEKLYLEGTVSSWWVAYTQFKSALSWKPAVELFLPLERPTQAEYPEKIIAEPNQKQVADTLLERFVRSRFTRVILEAFTAEHSARMMAMRNATDNASEMIQHLTQVRNRIRQAAITTELIEVVSGANALQ